MLNKLPIAQATFNPPSDAVVALAAEARIDPVCNREAAQCGPCWALPAPVNGNLTGRIGVVALEPGQPSCFLFAFEGEGSDAVVEREDWTLKPLNERNGYSGSMLAMISSLVSLFRMRQDACDIL
jgi:hypothetical protein